MKKNTVKMVIGSWGRYLVEDEITGSRWIDVDNFETWNDVLTYLERCEGFDLGGIDEELMLLDLECDSNLFAQLRSGVTPKELFELIKKSEITKYLWKWEEACALVDGFGLSKFGDLVKEKGTNWNEDVVVFKGCTLRDFALDYLEEMKVEPFVVNFVDLEDLGKALTDEMGYEKFDYKSMIDGYIYGYVGLMD